MKLMKIRSPSELHYFNLWNFSVTTKIFHILITFQFYFSFLTIFDSFQLIPNKFSWKQRWNELFQIITLADIKVKCCIPFEILKIYFLTKRRDSMMYLLHRKLFLEILSTVEEHLSCQKKKCFEGEKGFFRFLKIWESCDDERTDCSCLSYWI